MKNITFILIALFFPLFVFGQKKTFPNSYWEVGVFIGQSVYQGDLADSDFPVSDGSFALGFSARNQLTEQFGFFSNLIFTRFSETEEENHKNANRGFAFKTSLLELSFMGEYEPLGKKRQLKGGKNKFFVSPFIYTGLAVAVTNPQPFFPEGYRVGDFDLVEQDIRNGDNSTGIVLPLGLGVKLDFGKKYIIQLHGTTRLPFNDYLDGISLTANPDKNDIYWFLGGSLFFKMK